MNVVSDRSTTTPRAAGVDQLRHPLLELGRREQVDLARDRDDVRVVVDLPVRDLELDRHPTGGLPGRAPDLRGRGRVGQPDEQVLTRVLRGHASARRRAARSRCRPRAPRRRRSAPRRRLRAAGRRAARASARRARARRRRGCRATCAGARAAIRSATSTASSRRSSGRSARAASIPTTRRSTGPTSGPGHDRHGGQRLIGGLGSPVTRAPAAGAGTTSAAASRELGACSISSECASAAISGRPRPGPAAVGARARGRVPGRTR